jgi:hypothetical protein
MVVQSRAKPGRDAEYNDWYDRVHMPDICAIPGVKSGRRFDATPVAVGGPGLQYLAIYEIEADDPMAVMVEMGKRAQNGSMRQSDALDAPASVLWFYKQYDGAARR